MPVSDSFARRRCSDSLGNLTGACCQGPIIRNYVNFRRCCLSGSLLVFEPVMLMGFVLIAWVSLGKILLASSELVFIAGEDRP